MLWAVLYKEEMSFKAFVIAMYKMSNERVARVERRAAEGHCIDTRGLCDERPMKPPGFSGSITTSTFSFSRRTEG